MHWRYKASSRTGSFLPISWSIGNLLHCCFSFSHMGRTWLLNTRGIARKIIDGTKLSHDELIALGANANKECPNCHHCIDNSNDTLELPGLPAGVKFDPSDVELLEHLSGKLGFSKPHMFIDEFIPTLQDNEGICCTHPENLPGVRKDGSSAHFFHKTLNAYASGHRKRRKINNFEGQLEENVRWHKTGKTKSIIENGVQKGCKKIMVLYKSRKRGSRPEKSMWVMHQYHLGCEEEEREGEFVVSKIFCRQQAEQSLEKSNDDNQSQEDVVSLRGSPKTPKTQTPQPPSRDKLYDELGEDIKQEKATPEVCFDDPSFEDQKVESVCSAGDSQAVDEPDTNTIDYNLVCPEILDYVVPRSDFEYCHRPCWSESGISKSSCPERTPNQPGGIPDLDNLELDIPPDFQLSDLQFSSQDSIFEWINRL